MCTGRALDECKPPAQEASYLRQISHCFKSKIALYFPDPSCHRWPLTSCTTLLYLPNAVATGLNLLGDHDHGVSRHGKKFQLRFFVTSAHAKPRRPDMALNKGKPFSLLPDIVALMRRGLGFVV